MNTLLSRTLLFLFLLTASFTASAFCFQAAGARYQIDPLLLKSVAIRESNLKQHAINLNRNKVGKVVSTDYGVMMVNSIQIPELIRLGVIASKEELLTNPCLNVHIGAWVLARHLKQCGVNWSCLGSYNAGFAQNNEQEQRRMAYARKIYTTYMKLLAEQS